MSFNIIRNDITKLQVDAIVNAANSRLQAGGGVCGAIFSAAGREELQAECDKIGYCAIGEAIITNGFKLSAKYIIHTVASCALAGLKSPTAKSSFASSF